MGALCSCFNDNSPPPQQQQQKPQQHQQPPHRATNNAAVPAPAQAPPASGVAHEFPPSSSAGDADRFEASDHAKRRGDLLSKSQAAWHSGDKAAAHTFSEQGKAEGTAMDRANARAATAYFDANNARHDQGTIDLHGLHVDESIARIEQRIQACTRSGCASLIVIVGRGNHSQGGAGGRKIKPAMEKLVAQHKLKIAVDTPNAGCLTVYFGTADGGVMPPSSGHKGGESTGSCLQQ